MDAWLVRLTNLVQMVEKEKKEHKLSMHKLYIPGVIRFSSGPETHLVSPAQGACLALMRCVGRSQDRQPERSWHGITSR